MNCPTGPAELIKHNESGLLIPPDDTAAFNEGLKSLMGNAELRKRLAGAAEQSTRHYEIAKIAQQWEACFLRG